MAKRIALAALALTALVVAASLFWRRARVAAERTRPPAPAAAGTRSYVPIQDGKTIDFSNGRPVIRDSTADQAAMNAAVKDMDEAVKNVSFAPLPPSAAPAKK